MKKTYLPVLIVTFALAAAFLVACSSGPEEATIVIEEPWARPGQMKMEGSRLRPLICVGLAYFAIAVVVPTTLVREARS